MKIIKIKWLLLVIFLSLGLCAESSSLFGRVIAIAEHDTLNVRSQADYRSDKVAELPLSGYVGIEKCETVKNATWCYVYPLVQIWYEKFSEKKNIGWVNARYLKFSNRGYVNIVGEERNCFYALKCKDIVNKKKCLVVYNLKYDHEKEKITEIKTKWIDRKKLQGESAFGAASQNREINPEGGYCTNAKMIDNYLEINPIRRKE